MQAALEAKVVGVVDDGLDPQRSTVLEVLLDAEVLVEGIEPCDTPQPCCASSCATTTVTGHTGQRPQDGPRARLMGPAGRAG
jgi:hypothetical protein